MNLWALSRIALGIWFFMFAAEKFAVAQSSHQPEPGSHLRWPDQRRLSEFLEDYEVLHIGFDEVTGEPKLNKTIGRRLVPPVDLRLSLLMLEPTRVELKLSKQQRENLDSLNNRLTEAVLRYSNDYRKLVGASRQELEPALCDTLLQSLKPLKEEFSRLLSSDQSKRLDQLFQHVALGQKGMAGFATQFVKSMNLELSNTELERIGKQSQEAEGTLFAEVAKAYKDFLDSLAQEIPGCRGFTEKFADRASVVSLDVLFIDTDRIEELKLGQTEDELRELLSTNQWYELNPAGNWIYYQRNQGRSFDVLASLTKRRGEDLGGLLGEDQAASIEVLHHAFASRRSDIVNEYGELLTIVDDREKANDFLKSAERELDDEFFGKVYQDVFFDTQRQWLIDFLRDREMKRFGVLGMLYLEMDDDGKLFTESDRKEMREVLKREVEELQVTISDLYRRSIDQQVSQLPDSIRHDVNEALGDLPEFMLPNLTLLAARVQPAEEASLNKR